MANGDQDQLEDAVKRKYDELVADGSFLAASTLQTMELNTVGLTQPIEEGQILRYDGEGVSGQWVNVQPEASLEKIFIDGKEYLLVDNSGPEEMDPVKLQARIVELRMELDEAISLIPGPIAEGSMYGACGGYIGLPDLTFSGYSASPETALPELNFCGDSLISIDGINYEVKPAPQEECKLVSKEESDYERAMNMIGK